MSRCCGKPNIYGDVDLLVIQGFQKRAHLSQTFCEPENLDEVLRMVVDVGSVTTWHVRKWQRVEIRIRVVLKPRAVTSNP